MEGNPPESKEEAVGLLHAVSLASQEGALVGYSE